MKETKFAKEREVAISAVREAAKLCRDVQSRLADNVLEKQDRSPVTVADFGSQALVCRALREHFPDDPVMAEEDSAALRKSTNSAVLQGVMERVREAWPGALDQDVCSWIDHGNAREHRERMWILDPIDGTKGFLRGDQYAIALALIENSEISVAALACPNLASVFPEAEEERRGTVFVAERDEGAWQLPLDGENADAEPIRVSETTEAAQARFCESFVAAHSSRGDVASVAEKLGITNDPVRIDSQAKYALVARGTVDFYLRLPRGEYVEKVWDHAAGLLLVEEAGGRVTDMRSNELEFTHGKRLENNTGIVATNGFLHEDVLNAMEMYDQA